jgi:AAA-like domain
LMGGPISFIYGNCVFARGLDDCWAAFSLRTSSYEWLSAAGKVARLSGLVQALERVEADLQIVRTSSRWDVQAYRREQVEELEAQRSTERASPVGRLYVEGQVERLEENGVGASRPSVFMFVSLREPQRDVASYVSSALERAPRDWLRKLRRALRVGGLLSQAELERAHVRADRAHARLADFLDIEPARSPQLQWLVRRAFCRGLGEPAVDGLHQPRALLFEHNGEAVLAPLEADVLRWMDSYVESGGRSLRVESELGTSWQALLVIGALPERVEFPGARAELMFAPLESLPFQVDLSLNARFLPNELALRIARRRIQDADQIARAEQEGEQGVSDQGYERAQQARDLLRHLQSSHRPPLLRSTLTVAVGAASEQELAQRVEMCRRAYGEIRLHRPLGDQLELFCQHLPAQRTRVAGYDDALTATQVGAMMPTATHVVGSRHGFYLGHTLSRSRQPVRLSLSEGSENDRNATILSVGALGTGKTTLAQKLQYEAFLQGATVIDCDPKGDHHFHLLEEVAPQTQCIRLRGDARLRGLLDPLRVAPEHLRREAAVSFLSDLLPTRMEPAWETAVVGAVDTVMRRSRAVSCLEVVKALAEGDETDRQVAKALAVYARSGLTQLGFADPTVNLPGVGDRQVTYLPIRDLPSPEPGTPRAEYTQAERVAEQIVRLVALFAMRLMASERERLKIFSFDEGWRLLKDPVGRGLLASLQRMGRSELAVPIISTQLVADMPVGERDSLENLLGATFVFGLRSEAEAARALTLLGLDPEDEARRRRLLELDAGRCLFRDHSGRIEAIQVDVAVPRLLRALSTTPGPGHGRRGPSR